MNAQPMKDHPASFYLAYLEKEMTIMGILSTFCVAVVALALDKLLGSKSDGTTFEQVWAHGKVYAVSGCALMLFGGFYFYRQRSRLAWFYGQICLCFVQSPENVDEWLEDADAWDAWLFYQEAFIGVFLGMLNFALAIGSTRIGFLRGHEISLIIVPVLIAAAILGFRRFVLTKYNKKEHPFALYLADNFKQ